MFYVKNVLVNFYKMNIIYIMLNIKFTMIKAIIIIRPELHALFTVK